MAVQAHEHVVRASHLREATRNAGRSALPASSRIRAMKDRVDRLLETSHAT